MKPAPLSALIVDDDSSWQAILAEILVDYGLHVEVSKSYQEAKNKLRAESYRLAIVDLSLDEHNHSNQDGLKVLKSITQIAPECTSILLTGHASVELAVQAIQEYGAFTCLRKETFRRGEFRKIIHQALATPNLPGSNPAEQQQKPITPASAARTDSDLSARAGKALLVEDDAGWQNLLADLLTEAGYHVYRSTSYGEARGLMKRENPHLAIIDISLANSRQPVQNQDGYQLLETIRAARIPAIVVSGSADMDLIEQAYAEHHIFTCFEKQSFDRQAFLDSVNKASAVHALPQLTRREMEVLRLVVQGLGNKAIAAELHITTNTVKRHLKSIFVKMEVNSRAAAAANAIQMGFKSGS